MKKIIQAITLALALSGALNWGLISLLNLNVVVMSFGENSFITRLVYLLMSVASFYLLLSSGIGGHIYRRRKRLYKKSEPGIRSKQIVSKDDT